MAYQLTKRMKDYANAILPHGYCVISTSEFDEVNRRIIIDRLRTIEEIARLKETMPLLPELPPEQPPPLPEADDRKRKKERWDIEGVPRKQKNSEKFKACLAVIRKHPGFARLCEVQSNKIWSTGAFVPFTSLEKKVNRNLYANAESFSADVTACIDDLIKLTDEEELRQLREDVLPEVESLLEELKLEEFEGGMNDFQKQLDKLTRELKEVQDNGHFYFKRRKRSDKHPDERDFINVYNMLKKLKPAYLVGVWEIINETPGRTASGPLVFNVEQLRPKKFRDLENYLMTKLAFCAKSQTLKRQKLIRKGREEQPQCSSDSSLMTEEEESD